LQLHRLWLVNFRCFGELDLGFSDGLTAVIGRNGQGKTSLLEAVGYLATLKSFRGVGSEALIRNGASEAIIRAEGTREGRNLLIEVEIASNGRSRTFINRQRLRRSRDLLGALRVSVFAPDDLELVKGGPALRRQLLDDALVALQPSAHQLQADTDKVLRQRNTLLRQAGGRLSEDVATTLEVWDARLGELGAQLAVARTKLVSQLQPMVSGAYQTLAGDDAAITVDYVPSWTTGATGDLAVAHEALSAALVASRRDDLRRGVTLVGPHRDDVALWVNGLSSRTQASQGEQRCLALALRLAVHHLVTDQTGSPPLLLLDDVFSELDPHRSQALLSALPAGQVLLSTAGALPAGVAAEQVITVADGTARPGGGWHG
jgi:DNA replication and repair protein RecF